MPRSRGDLRLLACNLNIRDLRGRLAAGSALLALALGASLLSAAPARAQEGQIINPGSMAVTGFSGTIIPGMEEGLPPGVDPVDETFIDAERASLRMKLAST